MGVTANGGFEPTLLQQGDEVEVLLHACPFAAAALTDPDIVCELHHGIAIGVAEEVGGITVDGLDREDPRRAPCRLEPTSTPDRRDLATDARGRTRDEVFARLTHRVAGAPIALVRTADASSPRAALRCGRRVRIRTSRQTSLLSAPRRRRHREQEDIAGTFDVGGRKMYLQCTGQGSPTVILISGGGIAADAWDSPLGERPTVYPTIAKTTRVCAYDRPGTTRARAEGGISRSDPVPQPVTPSRSVAELHALLEAAGQTGPFVLAAHSYGGLVARLFAHELPPRGGRAWCWSTASRRSCARPWPITGRRGSRGTPLRPRSSRTIPTTSGSTSTPPSTRSRPTVPSKPMPLVVLTADKPYPAPTQPGPPGRHQPRHPRRAGRLAASGRAAGARGRAHHEDRTAATTSCSRTRCSSPTRSVDVVAAVRDGHTSLS